MINADRDAEVDMSDKYNEMLYGCNRDEGLVAVEHVEGESDDEVVLYFRRDRETVRESDRFTPFLIADSSIVADLPVEYETQALAGGARLDTCLTFRTWKDYHKARKSLAAATGYSASAPGAPFLCINDPVQQYLMLSGRTHFLGMDFSQLKRMQLDIECYTSPGYEFCNADREGDSIIAIALGDETGWIEVLSAQDYSEKDMLRKFVEIVRTRDPDVIEGHNIFNFDLSYIKTRAKRHRVKLELGRDGSTPKSRASRMSIGERMLGYERFDIFGRNIIDTLFLVHAYDITSRSLSGYGLKESAIHFGIAPKDRTYIEGSQIASEYDRDPDRVMRYVKDDIVETRELSTLLSRSGFLQAQMLPYSYQNATVRGNATKIDSLMIREYIRQGHSIPMPETGREFSGGYTDMFREGVIENVHHCDVRSLYPSLMLARGIAPRSDRLGVFLKLLGILKEFRLGAKKKSQANGLSVSEQSYYDALQSTFKILINSFYGYLGFAQVRFCDFAAAEQVTSDGRELLKQMIDWLNEHGAVPIEIDTDGIYFVPPEEGDREKFERLFAESLPEGIEIEFDGEYRSMYSYKMKNYALLTYDNEVIIKGAALKSRGLEPFQRKFLQELIRMKLEGEEDRIPALKDEYENAITNRLWDITMLAKTENLQDAPSTYEKKRAKGKSSRRAVYELALASGREYRAGDQVTYYVTGNRKSVAVNENSRLVSDWNPDSRDENVTYYLGKLDSLYEKFGGGPGRQAEFDL